MSFSTYVCGGKMSSWVEKEGGWRKNVGGERMWVEKECGHAYLIK